MTSNLLADQVVWVRALLPEDHQGLRAMFSRVSSETICRRFHTPYARLPEWIPEFLMDADERGGRSLVAVVGEEIVGHAMCSRPEAGEAEVAIVVEDRWQSRGVGKLLLFELAEDAKGRGVEYERCQNGPTCHAGSRSAQAGALIRAETVKTWQDRAKWRRVSRITGLQWSGRHRG